MIWQLEITLSTQPVRLRLAGEVDVATLPNLEHALNLLIDAGEDVELDLAELSFIDVAGMRALVLAASRMRSAGLLLRLTGVSPQVCRIAGLLSWAEPLGLAPAPALASRSPRKAHQIVR